MTLHWLHSCHSSEMVDHFSLYPSTFAAYRLSLHKQLHTHTHTYASTCPVSGSVRSCVFLLLPVIPPWWFPVAGEKHSPRTEHHSFANSTQSAWDGTQKLIPPPDSLSHLTFPLCSFVFHKCCQCVFAFEFYRQNRTRLHAKHLDVLYSFGGKYMEWKNKIPPPPTPLVQRLQFTTRTGVCGPREHVCRAAAQRCLEPNTNVSVLTCSQWESPCWCLEGTTFTMLTGF